MDQANGRKLRPTEHAESQIITSILNGTYPPDTDLPPERDLAQRIGVTRPTLRENLHRLAGEGWITIHHGKSTKVNNFWEKGGLSLLSTLVRHVDSLPPDFITQLLEFRVVLVPEFARLCARHSPKALAAFLERASGLGDSPQAFADFDWRLQEFMAKNSGNLLYPLILNDFAAVFKTLAVGYFSLEIGREKSRQYYKKLRRAVSQDEQAVEKAATDAMKDSIAVWKQLQEPRRES